MTTRKKVHITSLNINGSQLFGSNLENQLFVLLKLLKLNDLPPVRFQSSFANMVPRQLSYVMPHQP
jgi:hypothetical protein